MRNPFLLVATIAVFGATSNARADDAAACGNAFDQSQVKRDDGKLLEARRLLRVCRAANCSPTEQKYCSEWLAEVEVRIPSIVLSAKSGSGADLVDVTVTMDGTLVATKLDGRPIDIDPGPHSFVFALADGTRAETKVLADERGKGKAVSVTLGRQPAAAATPSLATRSAPGSEAVAPTALPSQDSTSGGGSSLGTVGLVVGAVGVVGLALGTVFGVEALSTKGLHCDSNNQCDPGSPTNAYSQATISTVGFVAGGILLAGGVTLFILAPKAGDEQPAASLTVAPMVGSSAGGVQLAGGW